MMNLNCLMDRIVYQIFKIISNTFKKKHGKIKDGYSLELLTPETINLLGSTKNKITENKNGKNVPHLEITEVALVHCNIVNNDYQQDTRVFYMFVPNKPFGSLLEISPTKHIFLKTFNSEYNEIEVWVTDLNH